MAQYIQYNLPQVTFTGQPVIPFPQPQIRVPQPQIRVPQPQIPIPQPQIPIPQPQILVPQPVPYPKVLVPQPQILVPQPQILVPQPQIPVPQPQIPIPQPQIRVPQAKIPVPQPQIRVPQAQIPVPQPQVRIPSPKILVPTQNIPVPQAQISIPSPNIPVPQAQISIPSSNISILQPQIPVSSVKFLVPSSKISTTTPRSRQIQTSTKWPIVVPQSITTTPMQIMKPVTKFVESRDSTGLGILMTFVRKYATDRIFEHERDRVLHLYSTHQITYNGFKSLIEIIDQYETRYTKFVDDIETKRVFYEKSAFGKPPRELKTDQDWGEALIELIDLINNFKRDIKTYIDIKRDPENLEKECKTYAAVGSACQPPCIIMKPFLRPHYCGIKR
jgi:hypothetical protein